MYEYSTIKTVNDLKIYFQKIENLLSASIYVNSQIRREWMLSQEQVTINDRVYGIQFKNMDGGIWEATITLIDK